MTMSLTPSLPPAVSSAPWRGPRAHAERRGGWRAGAGTNGADGADVVADVRTATPGPAVGRPPAALGRLTASTLVFAALYVLALVIGRRSAGQGVAFELVLPAAGVAAWWCAALIERPRWWLEPRARVAAGVVVGGPVALALAETGAALRLGSRPEPMDLLLALAAGVGLAVQGVVTAWCARAWARPAGAAGSVAGLFRVGLACLVGAVAASAVQGYELAGELMATGAATTGPGAAAWPEVVAAWLVRGSAATFCALVLGRAMLERDPGGLPPAGAGTRAGIALGTVAALLAVGPAGERQYLLVPLALWVASTCTIRGTAALTSLLLSAQTLWAAPALAALGDGTPGAGALGALPPGPGRSVTLNAFAVVLVGIAMAVVHDRRERLRLLEQTQEQGRRARDHAELLSSVIGTAQEALVTIDPRGRVLLDNAAAQRIAERVALPLDDLVRMVPCGAQAAPAQAVLAGDYRGSVAADLQLPSRTGGPLAVLALRAYPLALEDGTGAVLCLRDVTEERLRTEGLRCFARAVAHDLRNPLAGIALSSELAASALGEGHTEDARAALESVLRSQDRASALLRDISEFTLASDGELDPRPLYLDDFVQEVAAGRAADAGSPPLDLRVDADVRVEADPRLLARLFDNLLGNAAKYRTGPGPARVDVVAFDTGEERVCILVQDRGIGLPPGQEDAVFEPFHRAPEHARSYPGSGLGLAICRQVVHRHGGTIAAERRPGGGTTFRILLPLLARQPVIPGVTFSGGILA